MATQGSAGRGAMGYRYSTLDLLVIAVISAVGGVLSAVAIVPWAKFIEGVGGPFAVPLDNALFVFWGIAAGLLLRKPGVALVTSILTGMIEVLAGSADGTIVFVFVALQGAGAELGLALFRYHRNLAAAVAAGFLAGVGASIPLMWIYGFVKLSPSLQLAEVLAIASGDAAIGGTLAYLIVQGLERVGVGGQMVRSQFRRVE